ncbi:MAG TPA: N-acetylmuramoyl-L-alanine amidase [Candidatus Sulfotelmatobacter sp.]|nr:N-acetylmuramoyl-L-alanine amidase [Candidatus Sulfotelmatobacter sp.]
MATTTSKPDMDVTTPFNGSGAPAWPRDESAHALSDYRAQDSSKPSQRDALQALLAFSALHEQVRRRKALANRHPNFDAGTPVTEFEKDEQFVLSEVLQLVAERAIAITGADGLAIALAENNEIVLRAAAGTVRPDIGARIDRDSAFSGACFRTAQTVNCDDTETDPRVNVEACRKLGARSMVAVPLCGRRRVIGVLEAFSAWPFGFNDTDVRNLTLLAELVLGALKPEDEDRFAESAQAAATKLDPAGSPAKTSAKIEAPQAARVPPPVPAVTTVPAPAASIVPVAATPATAALTSAAARAVPVVEKADKKPLEAKPAAAPAKPILEKPAAEPTPKLEKVIAPAVAPEVKVAKPQAERRKSEAEPRKPIALILLIAIVIVTAFAGGVWWKLKSDQLGSAIVHNDDIPLKPAESAATATSNVPVAAPAVLAPTNPITAGNPSSDSTTEPDEPSNSAASSQELSKFPRVTGVRHWTSADASTVVLDLQDQVQYEAHRLASPDRIYFDLRDTQLAPDLLAKSIDVGDSFVNRIRMAQPVAGMTRIVLETKANSTFSVSLEPNPYRLVVEVRKVGATPKAAVNLFPNTTEAEKNKLAIVIPPPTKEDLQLRARVPKLRIVVDAGHGGWDLGTVGRRGLLEKDLVLEISQRLGKLLESRLGMEVIYTRQDDNYIPLDERASIANSSQADLFVSVHANYSDLPSARGVETYYTNFFTAPGSKEAGSKEPGLKEPGKDVDAHLTAASVKPAMTPTLSPADLHDRIEQSRHLAASVQRSLYGTLSAQNPGLRDRGVKEAGFVVLTESAMPGILAEVSFVSSPTDEQKLRSDGYREQIAEALYRGIARYAAASHAVKMAAK